MDTELGKDELHNVVQACKISLTRFVLMNIDK